MMSARIPLGDSAVSPPASVTPNFSARLIRLRDETSDPGLRQIARQGQRKERRDRLAAHGGDVAQPASQAAVADRFRRVPVAPEVNAFQREVGRDQNSVSGTRPGSSRSTAQSSPIPAEMVVTWCRPAARPRLGGSRHTANLGNQRFFGQAARRTTIPPHVMSRLSGRLRANGLHNSQSRQAESPLVICP